MKKLPSPPKIDWVEGVVDLAITIIAVGIDAFTAAFLDRRRSSTPKKPR